MEGRDDLAADAGAALYDDLLREAVDGLPPGIERLVVVPAGMLHRLPLAVLGPAGGPHLGARFALARVPSASWWLRWRRSHARAAPRASLSLADPPIPGAGTGAGGARGAGPRIDLLLVPLPRAREEARTVASLVGDAAVWIGDEASEAALTSEPMERYGLLHFATHAVVDDRRPEASALVLAPGDDAHDGFLQIREVVGLRTPGAIVFLSACRSGTGEITEGDGVLGLARGFFEAGARAVVASVVPVRDDEAAAMASEFVLRLVRGRAVAEALAEAQRARAAAGDPAVAWGAFVVLGDPDAALKTENPGRVLAIAAGVGGVFLALLFLLRRLAPRG
jgi:CHAT domain-containing protein